MPTFLIELATPLPLTHSDELARRVHYIAPEITSFVLRRQGDSVTGVEVTAERGVDRSELARKLDAVNAAEVLPQRMPTTRPVWRSPHAPTPDREVYAELVARGLVHPAGPGAMAIGPLLADLIDALDARLRRLAEERFGARHHRYPTLVSTRTLRTGGYLRSFPQFVMAANRLCMDFDVYREFVSRLGDGQDPGTLLDDLGEHSGYCLPPTMCFHTYQQLSGASVPAAGATFTSCGKSFRFESKYSHGLERLWDFTIREIVFVGDERTVERQRQEFLDAVCALADEWELPAVLAPANDPFFGDVAVPRQLLAQRLKSLKYELRMPAEQGREMAVASFNLHGRTFGEAYAIRLTDGSVASTACVGVGLERLAFAFVRQHGASADRWPEPFRSSVGG